MEQDDQLPEFLLADTTGLISNSRSRIKCFTNNILINANDTLLDYDLQSLELQKRTTKSRKYHITEFSRFPSQVGGGDVLCYENGTIQVVTNDEITAQYRPHHKKITGLNVHENYIISSSTDGSIALYDLFTEEVKIWYKGLTGGIITVHFNDEHVFVLSTDSCIRVYNILNENIKQLHTFDNNVADFIIINQNLLLFFADGSTKIYDYNAKTSRNFDSFKYVIKSHFRFGHLAILTRDKVHIYKALEGETQLRKINTLQIKHKYIDFDISAADELVLITKNNILKKIGINDGLENTVTNHQNEIFETLLMKDKIVTCSSERYIVWRVENDQLQKEHTCLFNYHAHSASRFSDFIIISSNEKIYAYNYRNNDIVFELQLNNKIVKYAGGKLYVAYEDNIKIYSVIINNTEINLSIARDETFESHIVYINISSDNKYYGMSLLNNYINIYDSNNYDLKLTLYGHSLPVRYFDFSNDSKSLISCGADKVIKLWGVDFGECRKTFIADSKNISYINNSSFLCSDSGIKYYKKHDLIKHYKIKDIERTFYDGKKLVATTNYGIYLYKIGEYEFLEKEESSEMEEELTREINIINYKSYDRFLEQLNALEDDSNADMVGLFEAIRGIDLAEVGKYTYFLNQTQVRILFDYMNKYFDFFPIVAMRLCKELVKSHSCICENNKEIFDIYTMIKMRCQKTMEEAGRNMLELAMSFGNR